MTRYTEKFARRSIKLGGEASEALLKYSWPGNVRELEHAVERAVLLSEDEVIQPEDLPTEITRPAVAETNTAAMTLAEIEKRHILQRLEQCGGNRSEAARQLGISRNTLARKLKSYGMEDEEAEEEEDA